MAAIFADDLARILNVSVPELFDLARGGGKRGARLPCSITTAPPRQLFIDRDNLEIWQAAANKHRRWNPFTDQGGVEDDFGADLHDHPGSLAWNKSII